MSEQLTLSVVLPATPQQLYDAWIDSKTHSQFTGGAAEIDPVVGGAYTAWDGYIWGNTLELDPPRRIVQSWRTSDFKPGDADSMLEVLIEAVPEGARLTLVHTGLPDGSSGEYREGWDASYFQPMADYFA